ncbi:MAG TPA: diacylglycerol kinase [Burkholderiaceae bacterium]|nr:diacylglycerol kinase [Burkholderiaceae bacterium]HNG80527.1 diacylglycerol kinase [Burkholderiaceae bacterium]
MKGRPFLERLGFALAGLRLALRQEPSLRSHALAAVVVAGTLWVTGAAPLWWAVGALTIGLVIVAELANTAIETLADHLHPERHPQIKAVKDVAAAAVLVASIVALAVALAFAVAQGGQGPR